jgi:hypothetical protein
MSQKKAFVLSHLGLGDNICLLGAVNYLTTIYEKVVFVVKKRNEISIQSFIQNIPKIELYVVNEDNDISPNYGCSLEKFLKATEGMKTFLSGGHLSNYHDLSLFPLSFYLDMNLDQSIFYEYFILPKIIDSNLQIVMDLKLPILFCHDSSSFGYVDLLGRQDLDTDNYIVINPCKNYYTEDHPFYKISNAYIFLPSISEYIPIIENADIILITDSSFWCLTVHLNTKPNIPKICYTRSHLVDFAKIDSSFVYKNL